MQISNLSGVPNKEFEVINIVDGVSVFSKHLGKDIMASLKNMVGGELEGYSEMIDDAKRSALNKMIKKAEEMGADSIINVRYSITNMSEGSVIAIIGSGTAIKFK